MQDYIYSVIAFLAMVIHLIINFDMLPAGSYPMRAGRKSIAVFWRASSPTT